MVEIGIGRISAFALFDRFYFLYLKEAKVNINEMSSKLLGAPIPKNPCSGHVK
jgi:hypothetical protein